MVAVWTGRLLGVRRPDAALELQDNRITQLPPWIGELHQLNFLQLWNNPIRALPRSFSNLQLLRELIIDNDPRLQVAGLRFIAPIKNLHFLVLGGVGLRTFPDWILDLSDLGILYLHNNWLKSVPPDIANLRELTKLVISRS